MRDFRKLEIWNISMKLAESGYRVTSKLPKEENYVLKSQIRKCLISMPSNIAEGAAKSSEKDFARFLQISLGSSFELETQMILMSKLGYVSKEEIVDFMEQINKFQRKVSSFIKVLQPSTFP